MDRLTQELAASQETSRLVLSIIGILATFLLILVGSCQYSEVRAIEACSRQNGHYISSTGQKGTECIPQWAAPVGSTRP